MNKLLIGTTNPAKFEDYKNLLKDYKFEFVNPKDLHIPEPEEVGKSFEEIAIKKAKYYYEKSGIPTIVDDGGFEVDALDGEPGVKSHRWLGRETKDEELVEEVLKRMKDVPEENRQCRLTVMIAVATPFGIFTTHSDIAGKVAEKPAKKIIKGYPYRSLMYLPNYGKYYCDITPEEYEILNHRKHALEKVHDVLLELSKE